MRVLVTGATGLLGHAVTTALADRGHTVVTLSRTARDVPDASTHHITADVRSTPAMHEAIAEVDAVCHLAALVRVRDSITRPLDYWETNVGGTLNVLAALTNTATTKTPKRLVLASTGAVYGTPTRQPITEDEPPAPNNPYAATKLAADMAAAHTAATGVIGAISLRAFNIAGAAAGRTDQDLTRLIPKILAVHAGKARDLVINGDGSAVRDFVHAEDMADAFSRALDACLPGQWHAYNIGSGRQTMIRDVLDKATTITGRSVTVRHAPPADEPPILVADASRAITELHWRSGRSEIERILVDGWHVIKANLEVPKITRRKADTT